MSLVVFYTSVTCSKKINTEQTRMFNVLDSKKIPYKKVDISQNSDDKDRMRDLANDKTALPPQIFLGDKHLGGSEEFENAVEMETLEVFLQCEK